MEVQLSPAWSHVFDRGILIMTRLRLGTQGGIDADEHGNGTITEPPLYQLIRQGSRISDRQFEIEFLDPGVEACSFTFG